MGRYRKFAPSSAHGASADRRVEAWRKKREPLVGKELTGRDELVDGGVKRVPALPVTRFKRPLVHASARGRVAAYDNASGYEEHDAHSPGRRTADCGAIPPAKVR